MTHTPLFRMAEQVAGVDLEATIRQYLDEGHSPEHISRRLFAEHGVEVPGRTVRRWVEKMTPAEDDAPDAA